MSDYPLTFRCTKLTTSEQLSGASKLGLLFSVAFELWKTLVWMFATVWDLWCQTISELSDAPSSSPHKKSLVF